MKKPLFKRVLTLMLAVLMSFSGMSFRATTVRADSSSTWEKVSDIAAAASSGKQVAITMTTNNGSGTVYALPTAKTSNAPAATVVTKNSDGNLVIDGTGDAYGWTIAEISTGVYTITNKSGNYLYLTASNNGVRVGNKPSVGYEWKITNNYLNSTDSDNAVRYLGVYTTNPDWRCYTNTTGNTANQKLEFWVLKDSNEQPDEVLATLDKFTTLPGNGSKVVIYYPEDGMALTATSTGTKLAGKAATIENGKLNLTANIAYLTVSIDSNGHYSFADESGKYLTAIVSESSTGLKFNETATDYSLWDLQQQTDGTFFIQSTNAVFKGKQQYMEYYNAFTTYGMQDNTTPYKFELYGVQGDTPPVGPTHTITVIEPDDGGVIAVNKTEVEHGGTVEITVTPPSVPNSETALLMLLINEVDYAASFVDNKLTFTVNEDIVIRGNFYGLEAGYVSATVLPSEHGNISVKFTKIETDQDVTIFYEPEEGYELTSLLITHGDVTEDLLDDAHSTYRPYEEDGKTCYYFKCDWDITIQGVFEKPAQPEEVTIGSWELLTDLADLEDGDKIIIVNVANNKALSTTYGGYYNNGEDVVIEENLVTNAADTMVWTIGITTDAQGNKVYTFSTAEGKKLSMGASYSSMPLDDVNTTWSISAAPTVENAYFIKNIGRNLFIEWYADKGYWSGYGNTSNESLFAHAFYKGIPAKEGLVTDLSKLEDGDKIIIVNDANAKALSTTYGGYYNNGEDVVIENDKVTNATETMVWTIGITTDAQGNKVYTFSTAEGKKLSMGASYSSMPLDDVNTTWSISAAPTVENAYFIKNIGRSIYIEWYADKGYWSGYGNTSNESLFAHKFYWYAEPQGPATGDTFGLASTLEDGDEVIIYHPSHGLAVGNSLSGHNIAGVTLTPEEGVITTANTAVVWTVVKNADGTYSFKQGDKVLGGVISGTYKNLVVTDATYTNWTLVGPDSSDFNYYLYLGEMTYNNGHVYLEYYNNSFSLYGIDIPSRDVYGYTFYKKGAEPETPVPQDLGDLVTSLDQLKDGTTVAIYAPGHMTALSSKPNGDWYLRANNATVENGKVVNFTSDLVWIVRVNEDGTYSFYSNNDPDSHSITVWPSDKYAEVCLDYISYPDNTWNLAPAKTENCWYISSPTVSGTNSQNVTGQAYLEAYVRNDCEVFSGYFTKTTAGNFKDADFALQFYLVNPDDAVEITDDGEWDGVLNPGESYVFYNLAAEKTVGLYKEANYAMDAIDTTLRNGVAFPSNGAYYFKVQSMGRYYSFEVNGQYLATNPTEELLFVSLKEDGTLPEEAKWYLYPKTTDSGVKCYVIYNKECRYNGTPVCIEYFSSVFSGWTFNTNKNPLEIYGFQFYHVGDDVEVRDDTVQAPSVIFDCEDFRYVEQDFKVELSLDDLAAEITQIAIKLVTNGVTKTVTDYEVTSDGKGYSFVIPAADIDGDAFPANFKLVVEVKNSYDIEYTGEKVIEIIDEPFYENPTPKPNSQTGEDKKPVISVKVGNVGDNPTFVMTVNDVAVDAVYENGVLTYTPAEDMEDGRVSVHVTTTRADGVSSFKQWAFTVGVAPYQLYFGQLHSHTTYSDGSGTLETALNYIASLPESANVQFVAFTDHSNYFDTTSAANPADAMNDASLMYPASRELWEEYKNTIARFNEKHDDLIAIGGYEMTWSGGPGHINSFNTEGLVSRNNADLNKKTGDAGMKLYYSTIEKDIDHSTLHQFNHPGNTFGNFTDFAYWSEELDKYFFMVEVGNGEGQIGAGGYYPSYEQYIMALDKGWHLAPTNNQDNHKGRWGNANDARDVILTNDFSEEGIYDAIRNLRVYSTEDKNLQITYTVNGQPMGTVFSEENPLTEMHVVVTLYDPDSRDSIVKVELVSDGGVTTYTWDNAAEIAEGYLECTMNAEDSYYFVRVTQADGDLAVTAPVWARSPFKVGFDTLTTADGTTKVYTNEAFSLTTTLYNNEEDTNAQITSITFTYNGNEVLGTYSTPTALNAGQTATITFTPSGKLSQVKMTEITATAVVMINGKQHTYTKTLTLEVVNRATENTITPILDVRRASKKDDVGYIFNIEGIVTSNASGYDKDTAFFDCIYVQDATGGICCFPVSGEFKIGDKVRIHGYTDFYQGEPELQVMTIEIIDELQTPYELAATEIRAAQLNNRSAEGKLVTISGTVDSFQIANGLVQTIMIKDVAGRLARVFIDGYITTDHEVENLAVGDPITATGIASYDDTFYLEEGHAGPFPRIRIRDRADIVITTHDHVWGEVTYEWSEDLSTVTATRVCTLNENHVETETVQTTVEVIPPTCERAGQRIYKGEFTNEAFDTVFWNAKGDPATGHDWEITYEWAEDGTYVHAKAVCNNCGKTIEGTEYCKIAEEVEPTCTEAGYIHYVCALREPFETQEKTIEVAALGHSWGEWVITVLATCEGEGEKTRECSVCHEKETRPIAALGHSWGEWVITVAPTCDADGEETRECSVCHKKETRVIKALGHVYGAWTFDEAKHEHYRVCANDPSHVEREACTFVDRVEGNTVVHECSVCHGRYTETLQEYTPVTRVYGDDRYKTAYAIADTMKKALGVDKFDNVILASGEQFPDALAGSYLAAVKSAPILLAPNSDGKLNTLVKYLKNSLNTNGTIYILGGTAAVPQNVEDRLVSEGFKVERIFGDERYKTNIAILKAGGVKAGDEILVCSATEFADALSAASTGQAILLVTGDSLKASQRKYLESLGNVKFTIVGGTSAVSEAMEEALKAYGTVSRLSGNSRYRTARAVAEHYYPNPDTVFVVYGLNYPDGLCAGPLAYLMKAPMLLATSDSTSQARLYVNKVDVKQGYVIGGEAAIDDAGVRAIFSLPDYAIIEVYKK